MESQQFTRRVALLLERAGFRVELERRVKKCLSEPNGRDFIPFDISFIALRPHPHREYVECKYRSRQLVNEQDVAKFLADLRTCRLAARYAFMATNNDYTPLAKDYAAAEGLRLYTVQPTQLRGALFERLSRIVRPYCLVREILSGHGLPREFKRR